MKSLIGLALILWVGFQVTGAAGNVSIHGALPGDEAFHALGAALGGGVAVLLAGLATVLAMCVLGAMLVGALVLSFPLLAVVLLVGIFLIPALLPLLIIFALLILTFKVFAAALCW